MSSDDAAAPLVAFETRAKSDTRFIGHPIGLAWLSGSEFWERFSYYGLQSLLVLYMTKWLFTPGHVEHVWGFVPFQHFMEWLYRGKMTPLELASNVNGLYSGLVYVTPLAGGLLADRFIGRTNTVTIGALLMAVGGFLMMSDATFLPAIACLLAGVGCFKGNIASQVGDLYTIDDTRRADGFQIYFMGIQFAVIFAPIVCGTLGQKYNWHWGFGAAGAAMLCGLLVYLTGRKNFPPEPLRKKGDTVEKPPLTSRDWGTIAILIVLLPILALSLVSNQEIFNAYLLWADKTYQHTFFGFETPITWMLSFDSIISSVLMVGVIAFWRWYGRHWPEPNEITKIVIGTAISACAPLTLAAASAQMAATGHPVSMLWAFAFHGINDLGFANVLPVGLALYSRAAPKGLGGIMIAVYYVHLFIGNTFIGYLGGFLDKMPAVSFWLMHAGLMAVATLLLFGARLAFGRYLAPTKEPTAQT
jgi:proton-dependent oligopeptide transporter, POT family